MVVRADSASTRLSSKLTPNTVNAATKAAIDRPKIMKNTQAIAAPCPEAAREIRAFWLGGEPSADLRAALKDGVINAITAQEMGGLVRLRAFKEFETTADKVRNAIKRRGSSALLQPLPGSGFSQKSRTSSRWLLPQLLCCRLLGGPCHRCCTPLNMSEAAL